MLYIYVFYIQFAEHKIEIVPANSHKIQLNLTLTPS